MQQQSIEAYLGTRREKNRQAAQRCRSKRMQYMKRLQDTALQLSEVIKREETVRQQLLHLLEAAEVCGQASELDALYRENAELKYEYYTQLKRAQKERRV